MPEYLLDRVGGEPALEGAYVLASTLSLLYFPVLSRRYMQIRLLYVLLSWQSTELTTTSTFTIYI